jgi:hypothetical protein
LTFLGGSLSTYQDVQFSTLFEFEASIDGLDVDVSELVPNIDLADYGATTGTLILSRFLGAQ